MLRCRACGKVLAQVSHQADPVLLAQMPAVRLAIDSSTMELQRQLQALREEKEKLESDLLSMQWDRVRMTAVAATQTDEVVTTTVTTTTTTVREFPDTGPQPAP